MRKVRVLCVGKTQEKYLVSGLEIYEKKLAPYCSFELLTIKEGNYGNGSISRCLKEEEKRIITKLKPGSITVVCDESGVRMNSLQLADQFTKWSSNGYSELDFIIGGPYGLSDEIKESAALVLSFSGFTLTHQMIRLFVLEQIYRSFTIIKGQKYHH